MKFLKLKDRFGDSMIIAIDDISIVEKTFDTSYAGDDSPIEYYTAIRTKKHGFILRPDNTVEEIWRMINGKDI